LLKRVYYARLKRQGKEIKRSLKTPEGGIAGSEADPVMVSESAVGGV
jgi:hypothetical protein